MTFSHRLIFDDFPLCPADGPDEIHGGGFDREPRRLLPRGQRDGACAGGCHGWAEAEWVVIRRPLRGHITICPLGGRHPGGRYPRAAGWPSEERIWYFQLLQLSPRLANLTKELFHYNDANFESPSWS
jgi:hypothetical protein